MPVLTKINTNVIADNAVTAAKIPAGAVSADIGNDGITSDLIAPNIVLTGDYVGIPSATTTERDALTGVVGMLIYNSTIGMLQQYGASGWASIDSPPTVSSLDYPGDDTALDTVGEYTDATCDYNNDPTIAHDTNTKMAVGMSVSGTGIPVGATIASVTSTTAFELSASTTGGAVTNGTLTFNTQTLIITGSNFSVGATVTIDGTAPSIVTRNSSTQITVTGTPAKTAGTKVDGLVVSNTSGLAASINVDYSALPAWTTASGNVLTSFEAATISTVDLAATSATSYAITTGALPASLAMSTSTGDITGTLSASAATFNFTVTATDAQAQSSPRLFNIIVATLPTGGTITTYSGYRVHTFLTSGTFTMTAIKSIDVLVVAGGGGGGFDGGGGGGAGGVRTSTISATAQAYTITVGTGGGGSGGASTQGGSGTDSIFPGLTADAGGGGSANLVGPGTGGSGGGGYRGNDGNSGAAGNVSGASPVEGYAGGAGSASTGRGGGGGGASAVGVHGAGTGGAGLANYYRDGNTSGTTAGIHIFGGGGGGAGNAGAGAGAGGTGGGGAGNHSADGDDGVANTGGGGGARGASGGSSGGDGGSGIVIIRYAV